MKDARVFISSSHRGRGQEWDAALLRALDVFHRHQLLDVWEDGRIRVSAFFDDDIKHAMAAAQAAVVLLTPEVLQSRYVLETEFPFLRERQQHDQLPVFPVVCEPCDWRAHDWLRATQAPNQSKPLSTLTPDKQDQIFRHLATEIAEHVSHRMLATLATADPLPEASIYLEQMPLTRGGGLREEKLIGREQELALLDLAFTQPGTALVSLVAWGGVGKTMLVQHWLQRLQREGWYGVKRVYAWSFFSQGTKEDRQASDDVFLAHALAWFGVHCEPTLSSWEKGRLLADIVTGERTLLILDGIEPLQYPPGPMGGQLRAPGVHSLLKHLARKANASDHRGLCLVTTREPLTDLTDFERRPGAAWGSVLRVDLGNLTDEAGAALLHHAGATRAGAAAIPADDLELLAASRDVKGHALTLHLLGRFLARAHGGDVRRCDLVHFDEADRQEQGGTTFKMLAAFEEWFARSGDFGARQLAVLRILGLFDRPADAGCLNALRQPPAIPGLTDPLFSRMGDAPAGYVPPQPLADEDWNIATSFLADFGLVVIQTGVHDIQTLLDCHPLIREYFSKEFREKDAEGWRSAHRRLYGYLKDRAEFQPKTFEGLQPLYQAVGHGCRAGIAEEVRVQVYRDRITRNDESYSTNILGAFGADLAAMASFFDKTWNKFEPGISESGQAWLLNHLSYCLRASGRLTESLEPQTAALEWRVKQRSWKNATVVAWNLVELKLAVGRVAEAVRDAEYTLILSDRSGDQSMRLLARAALTDSLHQAGLYLDAEKWFREVEIIWDKLGFGSQPLIGSPGFCHCNLRLAAPHRAACQVMLTNAASSPPEKVSPETHRHQSQPIVALLAACTEVEREAELSLRWAEQYGSLLDLASACLALGCSQLYSAVLTRASLNRAWQQVTKAVVKLRQSGRDDCLPAGLLAHAWLCSLRGDTIGAQDVLDEACDIAARGPMPLHQVDIHLHRARLFFRNDSYPWKSPQDDLATAEKLITECGYHRRDDELADARRVILNS